MIHDTCDEFEVWNLNKSTERQKTPHFHWKLYAEEQSCALGQPPRMEPHGHAEREATPWGLSDFLVFPLVFN